jgi:hypothetical protein
MSYGREAYEESMMDAYLKEEREEEEALKLKQDFTEKLIDQIPCPKTKMAMKALFILLKEN